MKIITFIQTTDGKINSNSLEALSAAQKLSSENNYSHICCICTALSGHVSPNHPFLNNCS